MNLLFFTKKIHFFHRVLGGVFAKKQIFLSKIVFFADCQVEIFFLCFFEKKSLKAKTLEEIFGKSIKSRLFLIFF